MRALCGVIAFMAVAFAAVWYVTLPQRKWHRQLEALRVAGWRVSHDHKETTIAHLLFEETTLEAANVQPLRSLETPFGAIVLRRAVTKSGIRALSECNSLEMLWLRGSRLPDDALRTLGASKSIYGLDLSECLLRRDDFRDLRFPGLGSLWLGKTAVDDDALGDIATLKGIAALSLTGTKIGDHGLAHLAELRALVDLDLSDTAVGDVGVARLKRLPLYRLSLANSQITDGGVRHLAAMRGLRELDLSGTKITSGGVKHLAARLRLKDIRLSNTVVDDDAIKSLAPMKSLRRLSIDNTKITPPAAAAFQKTRSRVYVTGG